MKCFFCGNDLHEFKCPMISAYEYEYDADSKMRIKRVEFLTFADILKNLPEDQTVEVQGQQSEGQTMWNAPFWDKLTKH